MPVIPRIHILKVGDSVSADGVETFHTGEDLDELAAGYNAQIHEAPVILGHSSDEDWSKTLTRDDSFPAYGWVDKVYREGNDLYVDLDASEELVEFMEKKRYKKRSLGYYGRSSKNNPTKGKLYIRHLAMLGSSPPAIKGLEDKKFTEEKKPMTTQVDTRQLMDKNAAEWLAFALKDDGNIVRDTIVAFDPEPTEENGWLYKPEESKWEGAFINEDQERFNFEITLEGEDELGNPDYVVSVKPDAVEGEDEAEDAAVNEAQEIIDSAETPETPEEEEADKNLEDQAADASVDEEEDKVNFTEEEKMGNLLKEKVTTEKEYAPGEEKPVEEKELRDDGYRDIEEAKAGDPDPKSTDAYADKDNRSDGAVPDHPEYKVTYGDYKKMAEGEEVMMTEEEYMEYMESPENVKLMEEKYAEYGKKEEEVPAEEPAAEEVPADEPVAEEDKKEEELAEGEMCQGEGCMGEYSPEELQAMKEELEMLRAKVKDQEKKEMMEREEEMVKFSESIYESGKLLESQFKQEDLTALLKGLVNLNNEHMVYGEGDAATTVLDAVKSLVENLPEQVKLSENLVQTKQRRSTPKFNPNFSKGSQERREKILAIMGERNIPTTNMTEYVKINRELTQKEGHYEG